ncbi:MAG: TlpA family protein disulfide reductase [Gammaproteobacteria bacterium]|nr:TlpA family protein disulfide reductase [Gammaproteobacteria bacterium]MDH5630293.1 TlpA family protein disulfide reductase [Gammaproteobacteria bacterium]
MFFLTTGCSSQPDFEFITGEKKSLNDYKGQWVLINFWAEWCAPCLKEIPELNQLNRMSGQKNMVVIGVSYDKVSNQKLREQVEKYGIEYHMMATEPMPILPFSLPSKLPANYLLDPEGNLVDKLLGTQTVETIELLLENHKNRYNAQNNNDN